MMNKQKNKKQNKKVNINMDFTSLYPHMVETVVNDDFFKKIKKIQRTRKIKEIFDDKVDF